MHGLKPRLLKVSFKLLQSLQKTALAGLASQSEAFHRDKMYQKLVIELISRFHVSSFVETGTYLADTTEFVARKFRRLPIFTCEVKESFFRSAADRLRSYPHVTVVKQSSEKFIHDAISRDILGPLPLFFLDAHWYDYWPLQDEVESITSGLSRCVIIVDDFQVPDCEDFAYCIGGGGSPEFSGRTTVDTRVCNLDLVKTSLNKQHDYHLLHPAYSARDASRNQKEHSLIGYVAIFQNLDVEFGSLQKLKFVRKNFKPSRYDQRGRRV